MIAPETETSLLSLSENSQNKISCVRVFFLSFVHRHLRMGVQEQIIFRPTVHALSKVHTQIQCLPLSWHHNECFGLFLDAVSCYIVTCTGYPCKSCSLLVPSVTCVAFSYTNKQRSNLSRQSEVPLILWLLSTCSAGIPLVGTWLWQCLFLKMGGNTVLAQKTDLLQKRSSLQLYLDFLQTYHCPLLRTRTLINQVLKYFA